MQSLRQLSVVKCPLMSVLLLCWTMALAARGHDSNMTNDYLGHRLGDCQSLESC